MLLAMRASSKLNCLLRLLMWLLGLCVCGHVRQIAFNWLHIFAAFLFASQPESEINTHKTIESGALVYTPQEVCVLNR